MDVTTRPGRVEGKVVVITGAAGGQGAAEARLLHSEGATVIACDVAPEPMTPLVGIEYRQLDVADPQGWRRLVDELDERFGRADGLVANAGITWRARVGDLQLEDLRRVHEVNVAGTLLGLQGLTPLMHGGGSVVIVGSVAALTGHFPAAYTATKWALRGLAKTACVEYGPRGIRVNTIHPGFIETPMTASAPQEFRESSVAETPLARAGRAEEVAPVVLFLISDEAGYVSGAEIPVDGGMTAHGGVKSISDALRDAPPSSDQSA